MSDPNDLDALRHQWHPVATSLDLAPRHIFHGQLLGRELAIWRADDGFVNVWENRCLHRGVRLSIGTNDGNELVCRYHGWRYANRSAGCTYIPAHPADAPARTICNRTFPAVERYGLVWTSEDPTGDPPTIERLEHGPAFVLRSLPVNAPAALVWSCLADLEPLEGEGDREPVFFVQPVDADRSVLRGVLDQPPPSGEELTVWRQHAARFAAVVADAESRAAALPPPEPITPVLERVPLALSVLPERAIGRSAELRVEIVRRWDTGRDIVAFELAPIAEPLPTFQPGAHVDVHLPNGLVRQYSITNGPGESGSYRIGVKLEPESRGGSQCLHEQVRVGDVLAISAPRNNFPLRRDADHTLFIAGGIGLTPLLAMAQALHPMELDYEMHYFAAAADQVAFPEVLERLDDRVKTHLGLSPAETSDRLTELLARHEPSRQVYVCGPGPMLEAARRIAADAGWPDHAVHFEYFRNTTVIDDSSTFTVELARSALSVEVPSGRSILDVLREHGVAMPSSCEQGACGTCTVPVLEGAIIHQDVHLNATERAAGDQLMSCVSRAAGNRLVLDI